MVVPSVHRQFQGFSEAGLRHCDDDQVVVAVIPRTQTAVARDLAVQKLRDLTIAIVIAAAAGVGVIAWVSAATIPGFTGSTAPTGNPATGFDGRSTSRDGNRFNQPPPIRSQRGTGVAVSGGSS
jgi:hypothetical protein